jgi:hypothetical protein
MGPGWSEISGQALLGESRAEAQRMISSKAVSEVFAGNRALPRGAAATRPADLFPSGGRSTRGAHFRAARAFCGQVAKWPIHRALIRSLNRFDSDLIVGAPLGSRGSRAAV